MPTIKEITPSGILIPGVAEINAVMPQASNSRISPAEREALVRERNTPNYFQTKLSFPDYDRNVLWVPLGKDGAVQTVNPKQGWIDGAKMVNAVHADLLLPEKLVPVDDEGKFPTKMVYDGPFSIQVEYARQLLGGIAAMEKAADVLFEKLPNRQIPVYGEDMPRVVAMENATSIVTNRWQHAARTLTTQHLQIGINGLGVQRGTTGEFAPALQLDQLLKETYDFNDLVVDQIGEDTRYILGDNAQGVDIYQYGKLGYMIDTGITADGDLQQGAERLAEIMHADYHANKFVVGSELEFAQTLDHGKYDSKKFTQLYRRRGIPPYANRHTFFYSNNTDGTSTLKVYKSIALLGGGAIEDHGVAIHRHPDNDPLMTKAIRELYDGTFEEEFTTLIATSGDIYQAAH